MKTTSTLKSIFSVILIIGVQHAGAQRSIFSVGSKIVDPNSNSNKEKSQFIESFSDIFLAKDIEGEIEDEVKVLERCKVGFNGIKIILESSKKNKPDRVILDGSLKGEAKPGRMLAVMGPSGSGKSSLIHAIAGRVIEDKKITVSGQRYVNGEPLAGNSALPAAFIKQEANFFPHMTVRETLDFRVELELGKSHSKAARDAVVEDLMDMLGLTQSAYTIVGDSKVRGLSGGERKRLSIACELISSPPVLILDEPTSGLDSYQASQVTEFLRKLAEQGKTIIAVIHQPSQNVFTKFDDLFLISEGRMMYFGEVSKVRSYLSNLGYPCPRDTGIAEHVLDCISRTNGGEKEQRESDKRLDLLATAAIEATKNISMKEDTTVTISNHQYHQKVNFASFSEKKRPGANIFRQFKLLLSRAFKETVRGKIAIIIKVVQQVSLGAIYGGIYKVGDDQASIMDRFGLLSLIAIGSMNMAIASTLRSFTKEKTIISSELAGGMYRTFPYFLAKAISEIPLLGLFNALFSSIIYPLAGLQKGRFREFLGLTTMHTLAGEAVGLLVGSFSPNSDVALSLFPAIIVLNIIFDGRNISEENTPKLLKFLPKVSLVRWGFEGLSINEFNGLRFSTANRRGPIVRVGNEALDRFGMASRHLSEVIGAQRNIIAVCWFMSYVGLSLTSANFEAMVLPQ